ncbi:MAG: hypothetical protein M3R49_06070 [Chloroflexota bacterium]|nr:hypothetical protein [Chloroflexota bacterium]
MDQTEDPKMDMPKDPSEESTKPGGESGDQGSGSGMGQSGDQGSGSDMGQGSGGKESESDETDETR